MGSPPDPPSTPDPPDPPEGPDRPDQPSRDFVPLPSSPFAGESERARPAQPAGSSEADGHTKPIAPEPPVALVDHAGRALVCPYCSSELTNAVRCDGCKGMLDPLSRQASQNAMGPWAVASRERAMVPGCSFETLRAMIARGKVTGDTIVRGPTTRQFWMRADHTPGVAALLGVCHACKSSVGADDSTCAACGAELHTAPSDRQLLGLAAMSALPGDAKTATEPEPAPRLTQTIEAQHLKRRVHHLSLAVGAMGLLLVALGGVIVWQVVGESDYRLRPIVPDRQQAASPAPTQNPPANAAATPAVASSSAPPTDEAAPALPVAAAQPAAPIDPAMVGLDPMLETWRPDLVEAQRLETSGEVAEVERALRIVERVLDEATRDQSDPSAGFAGLRAWVERLRTRADRLFAESILGG